MPPSQILSDEFMRNVSFKMKDGQHIQFDKLPIYVSPGGNILQPLVQSRRKVKLTLCCWTLVKKEHFVNDTYTHCITLYDCGALHKPSCYIYFISLYSNRIKGQGLPPLLQQLILSALNFALEHSKIRCTEIGHSGASVGARGWGVVAAAGRP